MIKPSQMPSASFSNEAASSPAAKRAGAARGAHQHGKATPNALFSNEAAMSPAAQRAGAARGAHLQGKAEHQPAAATSFDRAMRHAAAQRSGQPADAAAHGAAPPLEPGLGADTAPTAREPGTESPGGPSTVALPFPAAATVTEGAAGPSLGNSLGKHMGSDPGSSAEKGFGIEAGPGAPGGKDWGGATAQLQTTFSGARLHAATHGGAIVPVHAALNRALAGGARSAQTTAAASTKSGDTDPGGATPLPRPLPLPPATADVAADLLQAAPAPSPMPAPALAPAPPAATADTALAAPATAASEVTQVTPGGAPARIGAASFAAAAPAADRTAMATAPAGPGEPASAASRVSVLSGEQVRTRPAAISSASEAAKEERTTAAGRLGADQSRAAVGDWHDHQPPAGTEALPRASNRGADRGVDRGVDRGADRGADRGTAKGAAPGASRAGTDLQGRDAIDSILRPAPAPATTVPITASDVPNAIATAAPANGATGSVALSPAPPEANAAGALPTHIDSPVSSATFAAEAGYRIAVLVRKGIESAQLQLNPAEMGPVTVQIVVEGLTAQVHLAAAHADTRQALEASMPQLASSLRESGLTLTGGGVSDQPPRQQGSLQDGSPGNERGGRNGAGSDPGNRSGSGAGNSSPDAQRAGHTGRGGSAGPRRGVVDLVA